ncbi:hypothetical protein IVB46_10550 [Bradyrhizobium sp. 61]|uniref:hypothetical protein n=1 Tax=unclassified Bradyrhizobium TaxID=2631580 RepID=UPI001FF9037A|nr:MULTISPECIES: hypothetical protein [unclassified Bradyrhizobium]MCK1275670.1 hypothetical protein [Bradyrhizobium sp. 61]MCK1442907.1 hypothetical protein [Bradyrhizobium sp. 48]MCK1460380.1 hypothetical protein [Bradyrhizobium sp. 2]
MRRIVLSTLAVALIAASASQALDVQALATQALVAQSRPHVRKDTALSEQVRKARDTVDRRSRPGWQHSGWSAPAGR